MLTLTLLILLIVVGSILALVKLRSGTALRHVLSSSPNRQRFGTTTRIPAHVADPQSFATRRLVMPRCPASIPRCLSATFIAFVAWAAGMCVTLGLPAASAGAVTVMDGMPSQVSVDLPSTDPRNSSGQAGWTDMAGGVAARPYVVSMTVINGGVSTPVITGGTPNSSPVPSGQVSAVVSPLNLCKAGQASTSGVCYPTPNRVALTVAYSAGEVDGYNFSHPSVPVSPTINPESIIEMTVALNTLGKSLRWTWVNGDLLYWQTTNLGENNAMVHIRFKPATAPYMAQFPQGNGCTATPITSCALPSAEGQVLTASMVFSLDNTLDPSLTGAAFATQNALYGYLQPGGTASAPSLEMQMSSTHTTSEGGPQLGTLEAFIPAAALLHYYGVLPADAASAFTTTRAGDAGTNNPPEYTSWTSATNGSEGLFATIRGITFSVPDYRITDKLKRVVAHATARGGKTTIKASIAGCSKTHRCLASVYNLGSRSAKEFVATKTTVLSNRVVTGRTVVIVGLASKLKKGDRFLLVVHAATGKKLLASTGGSVR
jgi:hypothetical protein